MSNRPSLQTGQWRTIESKEQHAKILAEVRVKRGKYVGPGRYLLLEYWQPCPRGCCSDDVLELVPAADVAMQVKDEIIELAGILKAARNK